MLSTGEKTNPAPLGKTIYSGLGANMCSDTKIQREFCVRILTSCLL